MRIRQLPPILHDSSVMRIDMIIILGIILMIGWRDEHRIKIQHLYTQILEIIQLLPHALQIAAIETAHIHG